MLEKTLRQRLVKWLKREDPLGFVQTLEITTGRGCPDLLYVASKNGVHHFLELKVGSNKPTPIQKAWGQAYARAADQGSHATGFYFVITQRDKDNFVIMDEGHRITHKELTFKELVAWLVNDY